MKHTLIMRLIKYYDDMTELKREYERNRLQPDHVIDEDKSVKWNNEQIELHNNKLKDALFVKLREHEKELVALMDEIYTYYELQYDFLMTREQFDFLWARASYGVEHSYVNVFDQFEYEAEIVEEVYKLR